MYDRELGWYRLSTRSYDPNLKRFLQPDPSEQEGARGYVYAGDDPLDATDPSGLWPCILGHGDCGGGGSGVQTAAAGVGLVFLGALTDVVSPFALLAGPEAAPVTAGGEEAGTGLIEAGLGMLGGSGGRAVLVATATLAAAHTASDTINAIQVHHNTDNSTDSTPAAATGSADEPQKLYNRPGWRKNTVTNALNNAPTNEEGATICPTCGDPIQDIIEVQTKNGPVTRRGFDLDHFPDTWAERVKQLQEQSDAPTRREVLDEYNLRVRVQCPSCNVSHRYEGIPGEYQ